MSTYRQSIEALKVLKDQVRPLRAQIEPILESSVNQMLVHKEAIDEIQTRYAKEAEEINEEAEKLLTPLYAENTPEAQEKIAQILAEATELIKDLNVLKNAEQKPQVDEYKRIYEEMMATVKPLEAQIDPFDLQAQQIVMGDAQRLESVLFSNEAEGTETLTIQLSLLAQIAQEILFDPGEEQLISDILTSIGFDLDNIGDQTLALLTELSIYYEADENWHPQIDMQIMGPRTGAVIETELQSLEDSPLAPPKLTILDEEIDEGEDEEVDENDDDEDSETEDLEDEEEIDLDPEDVKRWELAAKTERFFSVFPLLGRYCIIAAIIYAAEQTIEDTINQD